MFLFLDNNFLAMFKIAYFILQYPNEETDVYVLAPA